MPTLSDASPDCSASGTLQSELLTNEPPSTAHNGESILVDCVLAAFCLFLSVTQPAPVSKQATSCLRVQQGNEQQTVSGILARTLKMTQEDAEEGVMAPDSSGRGHGHLSRRTSEAPLLGSLVVRTVVTAAARGHHCEPCGRRRWRFRLRSSLLSST